jgi:hypothetical protein
VAARGAGATGAGGGLPEHRLGRAYDKYAVSLILAAVSTLKPAHALAVHELPPPGMAFGLGI